jgi:hypothetical protein
MFAAVAIQRCDRREVSGVGRQRGLRKRGVNAFVLLCVARYCNKGGRGQREGTFCKKRHRSNNRKECVSVSVVRGEEEEETTAKATIPHLLPEIAGREQLPLPRGSGCFDEYRATPDSPRAVIFLFCFRLLSVVCEEKNTPTRLLGPLVTLCDRGHHA